MHSKEFNIESYFWRRLPQVIILFHFRALPSVVAWSMTGVSLLLSIIISLPLFLVTRLERLFQDTSFCHEAWPSHLMEQVYVGFTITIQFLLPGVTVMAIYTSIYTKFRRSRASLARVSLRSQRRRLRTNIMLGSFSLMFLVSWAPINILTLFNKIFGFAQVTNIRWMDLYYN